MPPEISTLPRHVDRRLGAELVTRYFFPVSHRSLERWPLTWRVVNSKAIAETSELFAVASRMLNDAIPIRGGRTANPDAAKAA
jgi:hypothetical protein